MFWRFALLGYSGVRQKTQPRFFDKLPVRNAEVAAAGDERRCRKSPLPFRLRLYKNGRVEMRWPPVSAIRRWVTCWLAWTATGLFFISQDFMARLSRNESIPWRNVVTGWMTAMYICAAFTPLILWLGR